MSVNTVITCGKYLQIIIFLKYVLFCVVISFLPLSFFALNKLRNKNSGNFVANERLIRGRRASFTVGILSSSDSVTETLRLVLLDVNRPLLIVKLNHVHFDRLFLLCVATNEGNFFDRFRRLGVLQSFVVAAAGLVMTAVLYLINFKKYDRQSASPFKRQNLIVIVESNKPQMSDNYKK